MSDDDHAFDLFISYAHTDDENGMVTALVDEVQRIQQEFERERLHIFVDRTGIRMAQDWEMRIREAVRSAKAMLVVLSPAYFASDYCRREWEWFVDREVELGLPNQAIAPLYTVMVPEFGKDAGRLRDEWLRDLKRRQYEDVRDFWEEGVPALQREAVRARLAKLEEACYERIVRAERVLGSRSTVPPHNRHFVGRHEELRRLREQLVAGGSGAIVAAQGLAGMGKSALAFEYAHAFGDAYPGGRYLIEAEGRTDLRAAIIGLADAKGVTLSDEERRSADVAYDRVRAAFEQGEASLLLFDNVSEPELLAPAQAAVHLPSGPNVHVLATMRLSAERLGRRDLAIVEVGPLPQSDALRLLVGYRPFAEEPDPDAARSAAVDIVRRLDGYTLALEVVAVFLWKTPEVSYPGFLSRLEHEELAALEELGADDRIALSRHPETLLSRLLAPTLETLGEAERAVLDFAAVMPPDAVVWPWLRELMEQEQPGLLPPARLGYPDPWLAIQRRLHGLRLLTPGDDERVSRMHRVVGEVVRRGLADDAVERQVALVFRLAVEQAQALATEWVLRDRRWERQALVTTAWWGMDRQAKGATALANDLSVPLRELGDASTAKELLNRALQLVGAPGPGPGSTPGAESEAAGEMARAILSTNLALAEMDLGRFDRARDLLTHVIAVGETQPAANESWVASLYGNLAIVERHLGNRDGALALQRRATEMAERAYQADHPDLARAYSSQALAEQAAGRLDAARELLQRAIAIADAHYPGDHPDRLVKYSNLAIIERALGRPREARALLQRALAMAERLYEDHHPLLATIHANLAQAAFDLHELEEARQAVQRALGIAEAVLGEHHPEMAAHFSLLASIEHARNDLAAAKDALHRSIAILMEVHGGECSEHLTLWAELAMVEQKLGDTDAAIRIVRRAVALADRVATTHPMESAEAYVAGAVVEHHTGNAEEARRLLLLAIEKEETIYPAEHPWLAGRYGYLSLVERDLGNAGAARDCLRRALAIWEGMDPLDPQHLAIAQLTLADLELSLDNEEEARRRCRAALGYAEQAFGAGGQLVRYLSRLAAAEAELGDSSYARELLLRAVAICRTASNVNPQDELAVAAALASLDQ